MLMHNHKQFLNYNNNKHLKEQSNELKPIKTINAQLCEIS